MKYPMTTLDIEELRSRFTYDPDTGRFTSNVTVRNFAAGYDVGYVARNGYLSFKFNKRHLFVHRAVFAMHHGRWPSHIVDHINGNRSDNRISNLREVSDSQNQFNQSINRVGASGMKGVSAFRNNKWTSRIKVHGERIYLGAFDNLDEAAHAYNKAAIHLHGEFARLNPIGAAAPSASEGVEVDREG